ncbi:hypothetical protein ADIS_2859 [Lunatimonas lonarensis]|uniref:DUF5916 domain-containing protein n=1 Tax=Lunatimonas lonarensis TaxID=1232681 RepID=R7ZQX0_9BACT|nr:carbohydrate binding family 9 domain-containing protein [Lunatimonas lonarensis]EON76409.1 hypothetical protein ADIS_2859 [Lunatimonas lonarensis]
MKKHLCWAVFLVFLAFIHANGQHISGLTAVPINHPIIIDGELDEAVWLEQDGWAGDFHQFFPSDTSLATVKTFIRVAYDSRFLYIAAVMYNRGPREYYVSTSLRRDFRGNQNDGLSILMDTFNDGTNAYLFGINPFGVQREAMIGNGGLQTTDLNLAWDNKWLSAAKIHEDRWVAEIAIPFSTLRYKEGAKSWNVNFYRIDSEYAEKSTWTHIPKNFNVTHVAFTQKLFFPEALPKSGANIALIPYVAMGASQNNLENIADPLRPTVGGDAKIGVGPALNLDLTFNPDFSQVEVDEQVTNLDRFEIFFPERRQFFLENADLFADFGTDRIRPFFSRRIGVDRDENTGQNVQNQILYGARLSGKLTDDWRIGTMNMQTASDPLRGIVGKNFAVAALQRKVFSRSNVGVMVVNRESLDTQKGGLAMENGAHNRLVGLDYNLYSADNRWSGKFFYHKTYEDGDLSDTGTGHAQLAFLDTHFAAGLSYSYVGENYNPVVGYTPRVDFQRISPEMAYLFFPASGRINRHGPGVKTEILWNERLGITDELHSFLYLVRFHSHAEMTFTLNNQYTYLFFPFDPTRMGGEPLAEGTAYRTTFLGFDIRTNPINAFSLRGVGQVGQYFNGSMESFSGTLQWRIGYLANLSMNVNYSRIRLPEPQRDADLVLLGPRIDLTFTRDLFWTTFIQYNNQIDNINVNTRLQWRYAPVSDLFMVYTDNYFPGTFASKQRAVVMKLNYWLNL